MKAQMPPSRCCAAIAIGSDGGVSSSRCPISSRIHSRSKKFDLACVRRAHGPHDVTTPPSPHTHSHILFPPPPFTHTAWPQIIALICNTLVLVTGLVAAQVMCLFMGVCATTDDPAITAQTSAAIIPTALLVIIVAVLGLLGTYIDIPLLVLLHVVVSIALAVWCVIAALWAAFSAPLGDDAWGMVTYTQKQWYSAAGEEGFKAIAARNHFTAASFAAASCILLIVTAVVSTLQLMSGKKARQGESDIYRHWIARRRRKERRAGERRHVNGSRG